MAPKKAPIVLVDEDDFYIVLKPFVNLPPPQRNRDIVFEMGNPNLNFYTPLFITNIPFGVVRSRSSLETRRFLDLTDEMGPKKHWSKKFIQVGQKIISCLKSFFTKTACSADAVSANNVAEMNRNDGMRRST